MNIASILRHWFTLAATILTAWIIALVTLSPDDQAALGNALTELVGPLVIIGTLLVTALWRMALAWLAKVIQVGAGEKTPGGNGELPGLLLGLGTAVAFMGSLPSCSSSGMPLKVTAILDEGALSYSSKGGLEMEYRPGFGERPTVYSDSSK